MRHTYTLFEKIERLCQELEQEFDLIPKERKEKLRSLRHYIAQKIQKKEVPQLIVICTHNSRRSHIGQIWLAVARDYYNLPEIKTFSGGTEATAFNPRAVKGFQKAGFKIETADGTAENPIYQLRWKPKMEPYVAFSKSYAREPNPASDFAAIMVCSEADQGCPIVSGCDFRLALPYDDPKAFDSTPLEAEKYTERIRQIGREMLFVLHKV